MKLPKGKTPTDGEHEPWTQHEINLLHEMVRDYDRARWLRKHLFRLLVWVLGLPAAALTVWEPLVRLWRLFKSAG